MTACKSCQASINWLHTATGLRIPIDVQPVADGNIRIIGDVAHVVGATIDLLDDTDDGTRYVSHFVSCRDAGSWRRKR